LRSRSLENIKSGLASLKALADDPAARPYVFYGLAKYLVALKQPEDKVSEAIGRGLRLLGEAGGEANSDWAFPILSQIFKESQEVSAS
jgi:hypothetical protein